MLCCWYAQEYSAEAIHAVLQELTPANLRIMLASKQFKVPCLPAAVVTCCWTISVEYCRPWPVICSNHWNLPLH